MRLPRAWKYIKQADLDPASVSDTDLRAAMCAVLLDLYDRQSMPGVTRPDE